MVNHKDLPPGAQQWARGVDKDHETIAHLEAVVQRLTASMGLDYRNPTRGINQGDTPSVQNPVMLKLDSLQDMGVYNKQDGDFIMWSAALNKWVPGKAPTAAGPGGGAGGTIITNLFPFPNPVLAPWKQDTLANATTIAFTGGSDGILGANGLPVLDTDSIVFTTNGGAHEYSYFYFPLGSSGIVLSTPYVFSFDLEIIRTGESTTDPGGVLQGDVRNLQVGGETQTDQYVGTNLLVDTGKYRVLRSFIPRTLSDVETMGAQNAFKLDAYYSLGRKYRFSNFMLTQATGALFDNFKSLAAGTSIDLLAAGAVVGGTYQIDASNDLWQPTITQLEGHISIIADGVELTTVKSTIWGSYATFTIPATAVSVTATAYAIDFNSVQVYQPISVPFFSGDTPEDSLYTYSWSGTPNNSSSIRTPK